MRTGLQALLPDGLAEEGRKSWGEPRPPGGAVMDMELVACAVLNECVCVVRAYASECMGVGDGG